MSGSREMVLDMLLKEGAYSNLALDRAIAERGLEPREKAFATALYYTLLRRKVTLDYIIGGRCGHMEKPLDKEVLAILEMGFCQLLYMNGVPDRAAVNESVELTRYIGKPWAGGFVNGVMRSFLRDDNFWSLPVKGRKKRLSVEYSCPEWIVSQLINDYGDESAIAFLSGSLEEPPTIIRVNTAKITAEEYIEQLDSYGLEAQRVKGLPNALKLPEGIGGIESLTGYREGFFHVQDSSSQICCEAMGVKGGERVLDLCAAPGGKTFTMAQKLCTDGGGEIYALELHEQRVELIKAGASRLGLTNIKILQQDSRIHNPEIPPMDKVLCDVPCFGLGVIRRKPEIKQKPKQQLEALPELQLELLCAGAKYLKLGGELVYSTCSLSRKENQDVVGKFLEENPGFRSQPMGLERLGEPFGKDSWQVTLLPPHGNSDLDGDGFFITKLIRCE